ncbi:ammonium transporter Rh type A-like [Dendronephthya gigantea]|uniref:ammonium transporter Rh type A-like n=1 Tax=Dendronephthya gigantea TaxID=151771 RepID=UPI001068F5D5|nr:ammonium transporter Rh type A-like [Dendronephthya gigantea]
MQRSSLRRKSKITTMLFVFEIFILTMYVVFIDYGEELLPVDPPDSDHNHENDPIRLNAFEDVHVMVFVGYGFLMIFLKRYGFSGLGYNFIVGTVAIQWSVVMAGFFNLKDSKIHLTGDSVIKAEFATATVLITLGVILGKASPIQLFLITVVEVFLYSINRGVCEHILEAIDPGGAFYIHVFGALFGLGVAKMIFNPRAVAHEEEVSLYHSDLFAMLGTLFLWVYWPGFNSSLLLGHIKHRAIINTYFALAASCVTAFACSTVLTRESKFSMVHIQNATLSGGVAVGAIAHMIIHPWGAVLIGLIAGASSTAGYEYFQPWLIKQFSMHDTCGVTSLHGIPGVLSGICSIVIAAIAGFPQYKNSLYKIYPARAPAMNTTEYAELTQHFPDINAGQGRSANIQCAIQVAALMITLAISTIGGLFTGFIARLKFFDPLDDKDFYLDEPYWEVPDDFVPVRPQILIPQVPGVALNEDDDDEYGEQESEYGEDKEEEGFVLRKSIDFSHALV